MKRDNYRRMSIERLEGRTMMTASANLANHILTVQGTDHQDSIVISNAMSLLNGPQRIKATVTDLQTGEVLQKIFNAADIDKIVVHGYGGNDNIRNSTAKPSELYGDFGNDTLNGGSGADKLYAASSAGGPETGTSNTLYGNDGQDKLYGSNKDDKLHGGTSADYLYGYNGNDELWGDRGDDHVYGMDSSGGDDTGKNILHGDGGNDYLKGAIGADTIYGGTDDDVIYGMGGDDLIWGGRLADGPGIANAVNSGNDTIYGGDGGDAIYAGDGDDQLNGGAGGDYLYGEEGNDVLGGGEDADAMSDDSGTNTFYIDLLDWVQTADWWFFGASYYGAAPKCQEGPYAGYAVYFG